MERLLHYVWKNRLFRQADFCTTDGLPIRVIDPGVLNHDAGPDFYNAKLSIGGMMWAGCVEMHHRASEWLLHKHDRDPTYDAVILHVVEVNDALITRSNGERLTQAVLCVPSAVQRSAEWLLSREQPLPCVEQLCGMDRIHLHSWLHVLLCERLERKTDDVFRRLEQHRDDWNEAFYITLMRTFGFGTNSDAFEQLAKSLPFHVVRKQRGDSRRVEALLFGQAGLLHQEQACPYYQLLRREYLFLQKKYQLTPLASHRLKMLRMRPVNFPHLRLAQLAAIWTAYDTLFSQLLEADEMAVLKRRFDLPLSDYWDTHYHFDHLSPFKKKRIGEQTILLVLINAVVPLLFAYGTRHHQFQHCERALSLLEQLPPEKNRIVTSFAKVGIKAEHAGDSQALIQLHNSYCNEKKCLYCRIGYQYFRSFFST